MTIQTLRNLERGNDHDLCRLSLKAETKVADVNPNAIAQAYKVTNYNAIYVALAEQLGYPLITADELMVKKL